MKTRVQSPAAHKPDVEVHTLIPAVRKWRQKYLKLKVSLGYTAKSGISLGYMRSSLKKLRDS